MRLKVAVANPPCKALRIWSLAALVWGAAEGFLFFVVPDVLISYVALRRGLRAGVIACFLAAVGAGLGGAAMYGWSARDPAAARAAVAAVPAVSDAMIAGAETGMDRDGWLVAALKGPVTSTPYKVYAMLAPARDAGLFAFAVADLPVRLPRFLLAAIAWALVGRLARGRIDRRWVLTGFTAWWLVFYGWFWASHPG